jgi:hypothetical protein
MNSGALLVHIVICSHHTNQKPHKGLAPGCAVVCYQKKRTTLSLDCHASLQNQSNMLVQLVLHQSIHLLTPNYHKLEPCPAVQNPGNATTRKYTLCIC